MNDRDRTQVEERLAHYAMPPTDTALRERTLGTARAAWSASRGEEVLLWPTFVRTVAAVAATAIAAYVTLTVDSRLTASVRPGEVTPVARVTPPSESEQWLAQLGIDHPIYRHMLRVDRRSCASLMLPHFPDRLDKFIDNGG